MKRLNLAASDAIIDQCRTIPTRSTSSTGIARTRLSSDVRDDGCWARVAWSARTGWSKNGPKCYRGARNRRRISAGEEIRGIKRRASDLWANWCV